MKGKKGEGERKNLVELDRDPERKERRDSWGRLGTQEETHVYQSMCFYWDPLPLAGDWN